MQLLDQLAELPDDWGLVAVGRNKRPYQDGWQRNPLDKGQAAAEVVGGRAKAIGVLAGPLGGGLMFLDHDGPSAADVLAKIGAPLDSLPRTVAVTSGRRGRFQLVFRVPEQYWSAMVGRRVLKSGQLGSDGKAEQVELRWEDHQSVVIGAHPQTKGYRWLPGQSPAELPVAEAPLVLIEQLLPNPEPDPAPLFDAMPPPPSRAGVLPLLEFVTRDSRDLVESGGTPGSWNDDQLRLSLDLIGTEDWIRAQGHQADMTARDAFAMHVAAAAGKARDFDERKAWHRFDGAAGRNPTPGTPEQKLRDRVAFHTREPEPPRPAPEPPGPEPEPEHREPFVLLGFDGEAYFYQPRSTGQVTRLGRSAHTSTNLCALAPLAYWEALHPQKTGVNWTAAASQLFAQQAQVGVYQPSRIRGRGAWWDDGRAVLHLGDRILVDGAAQSVSDPLRGSRAIYQRLAALEGPGKARPLDDRDAMVIASLAERFRWEMPASGTLLAGWVALAPICGSLPWRPHCWLTGAAGSGKSAILDRYVVPLLGDMGLVVLGNTTEPGIRQALRADALPVVFDEAESNERTDQQRIQSVLGLARVASSESAAQTLKGTPEGDAMRFCIRSMFLFSSIAHGLRQGADLSRFAQLTLRSRHDVPSAQADAHWRDLDRDLDAITREMGRGLQARTVALIPVIRRSIAVLTVEAARHFGSQRLGDQYGTLLAGAWSLQSSEAITPEQAQQFIAQNDWEIYSQAVELPDEQRCLQRILQHPVRVEGLRTVTRSIGELVTIARSRQADSDVTPTLAVATIERHGIRLEDAALVISNTAQQIAEILTETAWASCWGTVLARLPGAERTDPIRFRGLGSVSRGCRLQLETLDA